MVNKKNTRGQLTLFVILAVLIVSAIAIAGFLFAKNTIISPTPKEPHLNFQSCVEDSIKISITKVLDNGGLLNPGNTIRYQSENYTYLCFTADYYSRCYNYYPMHEYTIEEQILQGTTAAVKDCFTSIVDDAKKRGFTVTQEPENYTVDLLPGKLKLNIEKKITMESAETTETFKNFDFEISTKLYEISYVVQEIVNSEAQYCYFDVNNFMLLYPKYSLTRDDYTDSKIYTVQDRNTQEEMKFATRSCPFAPGV
jgi:hypothetical protein